jgi:hypothetical protein
MDNASEKNNCKSKHSSTIERNFCQECEALHLLAAKLLDLLINPAPSMIPYHQAKRTRERIAEFPKPTREAEEVERA